MGLEQGSDEAHCNNCPPVEIIVLIPDWVDDPGWSSGVGRQSYCLAVNHKVITTKRAPPLLDLCLISRGDDNKMGWIPIRPRIGGSVHWPKENISWKDGFFYIGRHIKMCVNKHFWFEHYVLLVQSMCFLTLVTNAFLKWDFEMPFCLCHEIKSFWNIVLVWTPVIRTD